jgi:hypothetical protein
LPAIQVASSFAAPRCCAKLRTGVPIFVAFAVGASSARGTEGSWPDASTHSSASPPKRATSVYFASFEAAERRFYGSFGGKLAPLGGLDRPGFRLLGSIGAKLGERDPASNAQQYHVSEARLLAGHEWQTNGLVVTAYAGLGLAAPSPQARRSSGQSHRLGPAALLDVWQSWPESAAALRYSSLSFAADHAGRSFHLAVRHGFGHAALPFAFGPEAALGAGGRIRHSGRLVQSNYRKARLGLHLSEYAFLGFKLALSGGAEWRDKARRPVKSGGYARLSGYIAY